MTTEWLARTVWPLLLLLAGAVFGHAVYDLVKKLFFALLSTSSVRIQEQK